MARFSLIPREEKFYDDFIAMTDHVRAGARLLSEMFSSDSPQHGKADEIKEVEHKGDFLTHEIIQRVNQTFIAPIDREDIHLLAQALDSVLDAIDDAAVLVPLYRIDHLRFGARELANVIEEQAEQLRFAIDALARRGPVLERTVEVKRLEHEADEIHLRAIQLLFDEERDPIQLIKWKGILDFLEAASDRCEDVVNLVENVVVKNG